ncbi:uncharacterized protein LOC108036041 [Drosophila biarmipes]|uniref:uncharacterized protein LOC108036041 n=1 Tax=Drosophila biarmipes TaxID=125945 RepID=UPI0007E772FE|nr:uncharacterized protein LOC108036041 [Drosophila biarmipes]
MPRWLQGFLILAVSGCWGKSLEARMESFSCPKGEEETLFSCETRLIGRDRLLNGTFTPHVDLDESFEVWINTLQFKNGDWVQGNIKLRLKACEFFTKFFGIYFLTMIKDTNIPPVEEMCPFKKGVYYIRNGKMEPENWPTLFYHGLNKFNIDFVRDGKMTGGFRIVLDISEAAR